MTQAETPTNTPGIASELTAFQQNMLSVLAEEPRYGLAVKRELQTYYDEEVNHGRLYPNLDQLIDKGLVEKSKLDNRTNEYALTDDGYQVLFNQIGWMVEKIGSDEESAKDIENLFSRISDD